MKTSARDFFLNILAIIGLYVSAGFFINLLFSYVNRLVADPLTYSASAEAASVRWSIAALVVIFPAFLWASWALDRSFRRQPEARVYWVRTWLLYFTLFAAGVAMLGDLVAVMYRFLSGDLTLGFILKVLSIFAVAGAVFGYYFFELRRRDAMHAVQRAVLWGAIVFVAGAVVAGFVVAGSPAAQRALRFDERRISDLQTIQWQIVNYWQRKQALPAKLSDINDSLSGFFVPRDPETSADYEYHLRGARAFELCASFSAVDSASVVRTKPEPAGIGMPDNWAHGMGRAWFLRTIDPDLYPPFLKPAPR